MFRRFFHVNSCASDMERSFLFYESISFPKVSDFMLGGGEPSIGTALGFPVKKLRGVFMCLGTDPTAPVLDLVQFVDPPHQGQPYQTLNNIVICRITFLVDDIAAVYKELQAKQVEFVAPVQMLDGPRGSKISVVCFKDPNGTVLELISSDSETTMVK